MICLVLDYIRYRSLLGPYDNNGGSLIPDLFDEKIPDEVLAILKPGDLIWMSSKHSVRSWLIMYYCHLPLSHLCTYLGNRSITHATTDSGVVVQQVDHLFEQGLRFLPCRMLLLNKSQRRLIQEIAKEWTSVPYSYRRIFLAWLYIVSGRNWGTFKWKFYLDFFCIYLLCAAFFPVPINHLFISLAGIHLAIILVFGFLWSVVPIPFDRRGMSLNMYFATLLDNWMLPLINRAGTLDKNEVVAAFRERA